MEYSDGWRSISEIQIILSKNFEIIEDYQKFLYIIVDIDHSFDSATFDNIALKTYRFVGNFGNFFVALSFNV